MPNTSKLFERAAYIQIFNYLSRHNLLINEQHGFRAHHSTTTALLSLLDKIYYHVDQDFYVCCIFLDFSKAFDTINHTILLAKLMKSFNFSDEAVSWIASYLKDRINYVEFNGKSSQSNTINCGVPQGSILGPLLFILYINDITNCLTNGAAVIYADDSTLIFKAKSLSVLQTIVNIDLDHVLNYCNINRLKLNASKCSAMLFGKSSDTLSINCLIGANSIPIVGKIKYLGFIIDNKLNFHDHMLAICNKLRSCNGILYRLSRFIPTFYLRLIFNAIGMSHINFSSIIISNFSTKYFNILEKCYNNSGAIILKTSKSLLPNNHWFSLLSILLLKRFVFLFKVIKYEHVLSLKDLLSIRNVNYSLRHNNEFFISRFSKSSSSKAFYNWAPRFWNSLPENIKHEDDLNKFKHLCQNWILSSSFKLSIF